MRRIIPIFGQLSKELSSRVISLHYAQKSQIV